MSIRAFNTLARDITACTLCTDNLPLGPRPVFQAHPEAKILIAGQAPGTAVHASGKPFDDPSGERLRSWLGVDADTFYNPRKIALIPMGFCYPGRGKGGDLPPRPECAEQWRERLLAHLPNIALTILLGRYAIDWHLPAEKKTPLQALTVRWQEFLPDHVALPHPSPRNTMWLRRNPHVEAEIVPHLQQRISSLMKG